MFCMDAELCSAGAGMFGEVRGGYNNASVRLTGSSGSGDLCGKVRHLRAADESRGIVLFAFDDVGQFEGAFFQHCQNVDLILIDQAPCRGVTS
jgi:hypothetical protein